MAEGHEIANDSLARKRVYCPHCKDYVSKSHFYQHKHLYYDEIQKAWLQSEQAEQEVISFEFSPGEESPQCHMRLDLRP